ncbi:MAG: hypothetical protein KF768_10025 [Phycisphaeraceae bacterium]|nr:hypothetical protein [Phycisphaeraceae bacterium]
MSCHAAGPARYSDFVRQLDEAIARCRIDESLERTVVEGFAFPLGAYPVEPVKPAAGYTLAFEPADGEDGSPTGSDEGEDDEEQSEFASSEEPEEGEERAGGGLRSRGSTGEPQGESWSEPDTGEEDRFAETPIGELEEWPDRYVFDILVPATRVESLCRALFSLLPGRIYPILDVLGQDEYREVDPYVSYELLGLDRFTDAIRRFRPYFFEDGLIGFGAMSEEPFIYIFVDEHKIITVRAEVALRERIEQVLAAFDLRQIEELHGADSVTHEHRGVLDPRTDRPDMLIAEEIVEELQEEWRLELNINPEANVDEQGRPLGITGWRCLVRVDPPPPWSEQELRELESPNKGGSPVESNNEVSSNKNPNGRSGTDASLTTQVSGVQKPSRYVELLLTADCLSSAQDLAIQAVMELLDREGTESRDGVAPEEHSFMVVVNDRLRPEHFAEFVKRETGSPPKFTQMKVICSRWAE